MYCMKCGAKLEPGAKFCTQCGEPAPEIEAKAPKLNASNEDIRPSDDLPAQGQDVQPIVPPLQSVGATDSREGRGQRAGIIIGASACVVVLVVAFLMLPYLGQNRKADETPSTPAGEVSGTTSDASTEDAATEALSMTGSAAIPSGDDSVVYASAGVQEYGGKRYANPIDKTELGDEARAGSDVVPMSTDSFVMSSERIYYAAAPQIQTKNGYPSSISGGGIYSSNVAGSDSKELVTDNAYYEDMANQVVSHPFGVVNGKLYYTATTPEERGKISADDETKLSIKSYDLATGQSETVAPGRLESINDKFLVTRVTTEEDNTLHMATGYSYKVLNVADGAEVCSLDSTLPQHSNLIGGRGPSVAIPWRMFLMGDDIVAVEDVSGNGTKEGQKVPVVKVSLNGGSPAVAKEIEIPSSTPPNGFIAPDYSAHTVTILVGDTSSQRLVTVNADDLSVTNA